MPLEILLVLVVGGIAGIALLLHLTGNTRSAVLRPEDTGRAWRRHFPEDSRVETVLTGAGGQFALVRTRAGPGVIWGFGADTVARHLTGCPIRQTEDGLEVDFKDYAVPRQQFALSPEEQAVWLAELEAA